MHGQDTEKPHLPPVEQRCIIVIPCYNEAQRLQPEAFVDFLDASPSVEFVFVDDGSDDSTRTILHRLIAINPKRLQVLELDNNRGKAEAVRAGMLRAMALDGAAYVGFWDADLATPLTAVAQLLSPFVQRPEIQMVFGSRVRLLGRAIERKASRHYLGRVFATVASTMLRLPIYDTQCGAKIFRVTPDLSQVLSTPLKSRWIFDVEIIARYLKLHDRNALYVEGIIYEIPLTVWTDVKGSKVKPTDFFKAFGELVSIYTTYLR